MQITLLFQRSLTSPSLLTHYSFMFILFYRGVLRVIAGHAMDVALGMMELMWLDIEGWMVERRVVS